MPAHALAIAKELRVQEAEKLLLVGWTNAQIAKQLGVRRESISRYLKTRKERMLARMPERQMALLNRGINKGLEDEQKIEVLIQYELDRVFNPKSKPKKSKPKEPPRVPMVVAELLKVKAIIRRDVIRYSGAEQPLRHQVAVGLVAARNANAFEVPASGAVTINLCDSEYGVFGEGRVKVREVESEPIGSEDSAVLVAEEGVTASLETPGD